jgi:hypothetical protein
MSNNIIKIGFNMKFFREIPLVADTFCCQYLLCTIPFVTQYLLLHDTFCSRYLVLPITYVSNIFCSRYPLWIVTKPFVMIPFLQESRIWSDINLILIGLWIFFSSNSSPDKISNQGYKKSAKLSETVPVPYLRIGKAM